MPARARKRANPARRGAWLIDPHARTVTAPDEDALAWLLRLLSFAEVHVVQTDARTASGLTDDGLRLVGILMGHDDIPLCTCAKCTAPAAPAPAAPAYYDEPSTLLAAWDPYISTPARTCRPDDLEPIRKALLAAHNALNEKKKKVNV